MFDRIRIADCAPVFLAAILVAGTRANALEFEPGAGLAMEYTNNATLAHANTPDDLIAVGYVGGRLNDHSSTAFTDVTASLNQRHYTKDTFADQRYFTMDAKAGWEMVKDQVNWFLGDTFHQSPINSIGVNTPDNIQNSNALRLNASLNLAVSDRHTLTLKPEYLDFYYEILNTDNHQIALNLSWMYKMYRLTNISYNAAIRRVNYDAASISDVTFLDTSVSMTRKTSRTHLNLALGETQFRRANGQSGGEFTGNLNWLIELSGYSKLRLHMLSDITDSSNSTLNAINDPSTGNPDNIQLTTDVIRNRLITIGYLRDSAQVNASITGELRNLDYSESPNDRRIRAVNATLDYKLSPVLSSGGFTRFDNTELLQQDRVDKSMTVGGHFRYQHTRDIHSSLDLKYRTRTSTNSNADYNEISVFVSLVYGYGDVMPPPRAGGI